MKQKLLIISGILFFVAEGLTGCSGVQSQPEATVESTMDPTSDPASEAASQTPEEANSQPSEGAAPETTPESVPSDKANSPQKNTASDQRGITKKQAQQIVLDKTNGAKASDILIRLDHEDGRLVYEGSVIHEGIEYEFEIDAADGTVIEWDEEPAHD